MGDLLQTGAAWLQGQRHAHMSRPVTYRRGADSVVLNATPGRTEFESLDENNVVQRSQSRDYILRAVDLVLAGSPTEPVAGDTIEEVVGATTHTYEVMAESSGEPPFRFADNERLDYRIHTKKAATT